MKPLPWLDLDPDDPFGLAALPYGVAAAEDTTHVVVRVGGYALDLAVLQDTGALDAVTGVTPGMFDGNLDAFMAAGRTTWQALRARLQDLLSEGGDADLTDDDVVRGRGLHPIDGLVLVAPFTVADYVDFYCSINHATNMGRILRPDDDPLLDNWRHLPVGYHGRAGTVAVSGTEVVRPNGLRAGPDAPSFGPTRRMDFELEVGMVVGAGSSIGRPVDIDAFDDHVFGFCLVNDWSARDIQGYEYRPLGPFLGKSFLTSVAPWVLPLDAVAGAFTRSPDQDPEPADYLRADRDWALPIHLEVLLQTSAMRDRGEDPVTIATTDFVDMYWTLAQMLAHATVNGASLRGGDLFASGTVSGTEPGTYGSMMELSWGGQQPLELPSGETRTFLQDGDAVTMRGVTTLPDGTAIGWGEVTGTVRPALDLPGATP